MKKNYLSKWLLLLCALVAGSSSVWGQAPVNETLWKETWTGGTANETPSDYGFEGTTVYGGATLTYAQSSNNTILYNEVLAGGTSPELLLSKNNQTWTISNIPTGKATEMSLTFKSNKTTFDITSSTTGITISGSQKSWTISATSSVTSFDLTIKNTGSSNARIDDIVLKVTTAGSAPTTCATPTFSPEAGAVTYGSEITITSSTSDATIYYTTDGNNPTQNSTIYNSASKPTITAATTIKAIAVKDGLTDSEVGTASYTIQVPAAPTFSIEGGIVENGSAVTLSSATGTTISYTTDGTTDPTATIGTVYSGPITINETQTIKAVAYDAGGNTSSVASYTFTVFDGTVVTFDATSDVGTSLSKNGVSFTTSATESDVFKIYANSSTTFTVTNGLIKRIEFTGVSSYPISRFTANRGTLETSGNDGTWTGSESSVKFTASSQVRATMIKVFVVSTATPTFSVQGGEYSEAKEVEISCATAGANIYYTTDGQTPTSNCTEYSSAISITETTTLKAIAIKDGVESEVATATYTMNRPAAPTFDREEVVFDAVFDLHLSTETDGATIYYTTDGSTPTTSSTPYSEKISIPAATTTVKAIAVKNGLTSDVSTITYTFDPRITPTFELSATELNMDVSDEGAVTLTTNSDGNVTFTCADAHVTLTGTGKSRTIKADAAGSYTVNVSVTGSEIYKDAAGTITVNVTAPQATIVNITFNNNLYGTSFTGTNAAGDGPVTGSVDNVTVVADQGSASNFYINNSETRIYSGGTVTITAPTNYRIIEIVITKGDWSVTASPGTLSSATWTGDASSVVFSASARSDFKSAVVTLAPTVTITEAKYATYCSPYKLDFTNSDVKAYKAKVEDGKVMLTQVDIVPANEGVVLYCEAADTYSIPVTTEDVSGFSDNELIGILTPTTVAKAGENGKTNYILSNENDGVGFYLAAESGATLRANRAYLSTLYDVTASDARSLKIVFDDEATGIAENEIMRNVDNEKVYNLNGQRVHNPKKGGLYIVNGKKVIKN